MASVLAFESRSMMHILDDAYELYFEQKYPIIYKNKIKNKNNESYYFNSPIDIALKSNKVRAVDNCSKISLNVRTFFFPATFRQKLAQNHIQGHKNYSLLNSDIFLVELYFDEWPGHYTYATECIRGYQKSFFALRIASFLTRQKPPSLSVGRVPHSPRYRKSIATKYTSATLW